MTIYVRIRDKQAATQMASRGYEMPSMPTNYRCGGLVFSRDEVALSSPTANQLEGVARDLNLIVRTTGGGAVEVAMDAAVAAREALRLQTERRAGNAPSPVTEAKDRAANAALDAAIVTLRAAAA